jgi:hypothetical protein
MVTARNLSTWISLGIAVAAAACSASKAPAGAASGPAGPDDSDAGGSLSVNAPDADGADAPAVGPTTDAKAPPTGLLVQEWGTYTSVQASDGHTLNGVHHVDESLPAWVHRRNFSDPSNYFFEQLPEEPLQQLETPVLYFWSPTATNVSVQVHFPAGVVGEWYPDSTTFAPAIGGCTAMAGGTMTWDVTVDPAVAPASFAAVSPTEIWAPSRNVASTPVRRTAPGGGVDEQEQFIFYRGLAKFDPPVRVVATDTELHVSNTSTDDVAAAFVLRVTATQAQIVSIGSLPAGGTRVAPIPAASRPLDAYVAEAQGMLHAALAGTGLNDDVAKAMVDTWTRSWFKNVGLRVLYLAPRAWTDSWLPTSITPAPSSFVRTLVGRVEALTPSEETQLVAAVQAAAKTGAAFDIPSLGRFAEPRLWRAVELLSAPADVAYAKNLVATAHAQP